MPDGDSSTSTQTRTQQTMSDIEAVQKSHAMHIADLKDHAESTRQLQHDSNKLAKAAKENSDKALNTAKAIWYLQRKHEEHSARLEDRRDAKIKTIETRLTELDKENMISKTRADERNNFSRKEYGKRVLLLALCGTAAGLVQAVLSALPPH
jgi:hypothetical protein